MHIQFHSIRFKNFLQVGNEFETFSLGSDPFTVIIGKNGTGKSTLLDAITYVLFKKPYRKIKLGQLINNTNRKGMLVEVAFTIGNDTYVVRRGEKPKVFEIFKNKVLVETDPSVGDYQTQLEQVILRQDYKTFCQINVIGKAKYVQFMNLETKDRRPIVEDLLDSYIYTVMQGIAKGKLKSLKEDLSSFNTELQIINSKIETTKNVLNSFESQKQDRLKDANDLLETFERELKLCEDKRLVLASREEVVAAEVEKTIPAKYRDEFQRRKTAVQQDIGALNSSIRKCEVIIAKIDELEECPHCMQVVDTSHKQKIVNENNMQILADQAQLQEAQQKLVKMQEIERKFNQVSGDLQHAKSEVDRNNQLIKTNQQNIERQKTQIEQIKASELPNLPDLQDLEQKRVNLVNSYDETQLNIDKYNKALNYLGDDGLKANLVQKYIPVINKTINAYLEKMQMFVEFTLDSEFNETINAVNRDLFTYNSFSEGQRMRIDLAILLTWRQIAKLRNSMSTNLFILDEIADGSLDDEGMSEFFSILKSVSDSQNTFIISHKESTIELFDKVVRAETIGNFTRYRNE